MLDHLPERDRDTVKRRLRQAWQDTDHDIALEQLNTRALELDRAHPGAANSLREGMEETLTVTRLGITGKLKRTLESTNPCESMISTVRAINRNVKNWSSGEMALRSPPTPRSRKPKRPRSPPANVAPPSPPPERLNGQSRPALLPADPPRGCGRNLLHRVC